MTREELERCSEMDDSNESGRKARGQGHRTYRRQGYQRGRGLRLMEINSWFRYP